MNTVAWDDDGDEVEENEKKGLDYDSKWARCRFSLHVILSVISLGVFVVLFYQDVNTSYNGVLALLPDSLYITVDGCSLNFTSGLQDDDSVLVEISYTSVGDIELDDSILSVTGGEDCQITLVIGPNTKLPPTTIDIIGTHSLVELSGLVVSGPLDVTGSFATTLVISDTTATDLTVNISSGSVTSLFSEFDNASVLVEDGFVSVTSKNGFMLHYTVSYDSVCLGAPVTPKFLSSSVSYQDCTSTNCSSSNSTTSTVLLQRNESEAVSKTFNAICTNGEIHATVYTQGVDNNIFRGGQDTLPPAANLTDVAEIAEQIKPSDSSVIAADLITLYVHGAGIPVEPSTWIWANTKAYILLAPQYMNFLSLGLLTPVQHSHDLQISPSFCPSYFPYSAQADLRRKYDTYLLIRSVVGEHGHVVYQHSGSGPYYTIRLDDRTGLVIESPMVWTSDALLVLMNVLGILLPTILATVALFIIVKVVRKRWDSYYEDYVKEYRLTAVTLSKLVLSSRSENEAQGFNSSFIQQKGIFWYIHSEVTDLVNAQLLKRVNKDFISNNSKTDKVLVDPNAPRIVQLEDVLSEKAPPSKHKQMATKAGRFLVQLAQQTAIVVGVFVIFYVLAAPLLIASLLYESGTRQFAFRYVASAITGGFLLLGFVELGLHMWEVYRFFKFRYWLQRVLHFYMALIVWIGIGYLFLVATWFLLGILINPERSLPYGAAVATLGVHAGTTFRRLKTWKEKVVGAFKDAIDSAMRVVPITLSASTVDTVIQFTRQNLPGFNNSGGDEDEENAADPQATLAQVMRSTREVQGNADEVNQLGEQHQATLTSIIDIILAGLRDSTPPQEILQGVINGPVSELLRVHSITSLDDLFCSMFSQLDEAGEHELEFQRLLKKEAVDHLVSDVLFKLANMVNETQLSEQMWRICYDFFQDMPFVKTFQVCLSMHNQAVQNSSEVTTMGETPLKKMFTLLLSEVQANPRISELFIDALLEVVKRPIGDPYTPSDANSPPVMSQKTFMQFVQTFMEVFGTSVSATLPAQLTGMSTQDVPESTNSPFSFFQCVPRYMLQHLDSSECSVALKEITTAMLIARIPRSITPASLSEPTAIRDALEDFITNVDRLEYSDLEAIVKKVTSALDDCLGKGKLAPLASKIKAEHKKIVTDSKHDDTLVKIMQAVARLLKDQLSDATIISNYRVHLKHWLGFANSDLARLGINCFVDALDTRNILFSIACKYTMSHSLFDLLRGLQPKDLITVFADFHVGPKFFYDFLKIALIDLIEDCLDFDRKEREWAEEDKERTEKEAEKGREADKEKERLENDNKPKGKGKGKSSVEPKVLDTLKPAAEIETTKDSEKKSSYLECLAQPTVDMLNSHIGASNTEPLTFKQIDQVFALVYDLVYNQIGNFKEVASSMLRELLVCGQQIQGGTAAIDTMREVFSHLSPSFASLEEFNTSREKGSFWSMATNVIFPPLVTSLQPPMWNVVIQDAFPALARLFGSQLWAPGLATANDLQKIEICTAVNESIRESLLGPVRIPLLGDKLLALVVRYLQGGADDQTREQVLGLWIRLVDARGLISTLLERLSPYLLNANLTISAAQNSAISNCEPVALDILLKLARATAPSEGTSQRFDRFVREFVLSTVMPKIKSDVLANTPAMKASEVYSCFTDRLCGLGLGKLVAVLDRYRAECLETAYLTCLLSSVEHLLQKYPPTSLVSILLASLKYKKGVKDILDEILLRVDPLELVLELTCSFLVIPIMSKPVFQDFSLLPHNLHMKLKGVKTELIDSCSTLFDSFTSSPKRVTPTFQTLATTVGDAMQGEDVTKFSDQVTDIVGDFLAGPVSGLIRDFLEKLVKTSNRGQEVVRDNLCDVLDEIAIRLGDTPLHFLSFVLEEVQEQLKTQEFVMQKVIEGLLAELGSAMSQENACYVVIADLIAWIRPVEEKMKNDNKTKVHFTNEPDSDGDSKKPKKSKKHKDKAKKSTKASKKGGATKATYNAISVVTQSVLKSSDSILPGVMKTFVRSLVPFDLLYQLNEIATLSVDILRNFRKDLNTDGITSLIANVCLILLPNINVSSLMKNALIPCLVEVLAGMTREVDHLTDSFISRLYDLTLDIIIPNLIEELAESSEFREEVLALIDDSTFMNDKSLDFLSNPLKEAYDRLSDPKCFKFLLRDIMGQVSEALKADKIKKDSPLMEILRLDTKSGDSKRGSSFSQKLSGMVEKAIKDLLFPHNFAPMVQEIGFSKYSLSASIFEVLTKQLCTSPVTEAEIVGALAPAAKIFDKFGMLVKGKALDEVVDQMLLNDLFTTIVTQLSVSKVPQIATLIDLFAKMNSTFLQKEEIITTLRSQVNKFLISEHEVLGFLLTNINRGASIEQFVTTLRALLEQIFSSSVAQHRLCTLSLDMAVSMLQTVCLRSVDATKEEILREVQDKLDKGNPRVDVFKDAILRAGKSLEIWTVPYLSLLHHAVHATLDETDSSLCLRFLNELCSKLFGSIVHVNAKKQFDRAVNSRAEARNMINSLFDGLDDALGKASNKKLYTYSKLILDCIGTMEPLKFLLPVFGESFPTIGARPHHVGAVMFLSMGSRLALVKGIIADIRPKTAKAIDLVAGAILQQPNMSFELLIRKLLSKTDPQAIIKHVMVGISSILGNPQCYLETLLHGVKDSMSPQQLRDCMMRALDKTSIPLSFIYSSFGKVSAQAGLYLQKANYPAKFLHDMVHKASVFLPKAVNSLPADIPDRMQELAVQMFQEVFAGFNTLLQKDNVAVPTVKAIVETLKANPIFTMDCDGELKHSYSVGLLHNLMNFFKSQIKDMGNLADEALHCGELMDSTTEDKYTNVLLYMFGRLALGVDSGAMLSEYICFPVVLSSASFGVTSINLKLPLVNAMFCESNVNFLEKYKLGELFSHILEHVALYVLTTEKAPVFRDDIEDELKKIEKKIDFEADKCSDDFDKFFNALGDKLKGSPLAALATAFDHKFMIKTDILTGRMVDYLVELLQGAKLEDKILKLVQNFTTPEAAVRGMAEIILKIPVHVEGQTLSSPALLLKGLAEDYFVYVAFFAFFAPPNADHFKKAFKFSTNNPLMGAVVEKMKATANPSQFINSACKVVTKVVDQHFRGYLRKFVISEVIPHIAKKINTIPHATLANVVEQIEESLAGTPLDKLRPLLVPIRGTPIGRIFVKELVVSLLDTVGMALQHTSALLDVFVDRIVGNFQFPLTAEILEEFTSSLDSSRLLATFGDRLLHVLVPFNLLASIRPKSEVTTYAPSPAAPAASVFIDEPFRADEDEKPLGAERPTLAKDDKISIAEKPSFANTIAKVTAPLAHKGYSLLPDANPDSPVALRKTPALTQEPLRKLQEQQNELSFDLLAQLAESALDIIEPDDFLEILTTLIASLPPSFTSVAGEGLLKSKEHLFSGMCSLVASFAVDVVLPPLLKDDFSFLSRIDNISVLFNLEDVKSMLQTSLKDFITQHVRMNVSRIPDYEAFALKFISIVNSGKSKDLRQLVLYVLQWDALIADILDHVSSTLTHHFFLEEIPRLSIELKQQTGDSDLLLHQISNSLVPQQTPVAVTKDFFISVFNILCEDLPDVRNKLQHKAGTIGDFKFPMDLLGMLEAAPQHSCLKAIPILLNMLPPIPRRILAPHLHAVGAVGAKHVVSSFFAATKAAIQKASSSIKFDILSHSPLRSLEEVATQVTQFFVDNPREWAGLVRMAFGQLTRTLLATSSSNSVAQELLQEVGEALLEQMNASGMASDISEKLRHWIFIAEVEESNNSNGLSDVKQGISDLVFKQLLPKILKEVLDLIVTLPPQKGVPNIPDLFLQMVVDNLQELLEDSPFFVLSKLIRRAKDVIFASTSAPASQYAGIVFASIRDRVVDAIKNPSDYDDDNWLTDLMIVADARGRDISQVMRVLMSYFDLGKILSIVTQELIRSVMFPHQLVVGGFIGQAALALTQQPELVQQVQQMLLSNAQSTLWPALIDAVKTSFPSQTEVATFGDDIIQSQVKQLLYPITLSWNLGDGKECDILSWFNSFTIPSTLKIAVAHDLPKRMFKFMRLMEQKLARPLKDGQDQSKPSYVVMKAFLAGVADLKSGSNIDKSVDGILNNISQLLEEGSMYDEFCATIVQTLLKPLAKYVCFTLPSKFWTQVRAIQAQGKSEEQALIQLANDPPFQMFKRYTTPLLNSFYPMFRSFTSVALAHMKPAAQHAHLYELIHCMIVHLAPDADTPQLLSVYQDLKQRASDISADLARRMLSKLSPIIINIFEPITKEPNSFAIKLHDFVRVVMEEAVVKCPDDVVRDYASQICEQLLALGSKVESEDQADVQTFLDTPLGNRNAHQWIAEVLALIAEATNTESQGPLYQIVYGMGRLFIRPVDDLIFNATKQESELELLRSFTDKSQQLEVFVKHAIRLLSYHIVNVFKSQPKPPSTFPNKREPFTQCWSEYFLQVVFKKIFHSSSVIHKVLGDTSETSPFYLWLSPVLDQYTSREAASQLVTYTMSSTADAKFLVDFIDNTLKVLTNGPMNFLVGEPYKVPLRMNLKNFDPAKANELVNNIVTYLLVEIGKSMRSDLVSAVPEILAFASSDLQANRSNIGHLIVQMTASCVNAPKSMEVVTEVVRQLVTNSMMQGVSQPLPPTALNRQFLEIPKETISLIPTESTRLMVMFIEVLQSRCLDSFQTKSGDLVHQVLRNSQSTLKTIDQFLGKSAPTVEKGVKVLTDIDQELNSGLSFISDRVYAQVKDQVGQISTEDDELKEICETTTSKELKTKVKSIFGVTSAQLAVTLSTTIVILLLLFAFIFVGMQVFKGESALKTFVNTGLVAGAGLFTNMGQGKSGSSVFENVGVKVKKLLVAALAAAVDAVLVKSIAEKVVHVLMEDDNCLKELMSSNDSNV